MRQNEDSLAFIFFPTLFQKYSYLPLHKMYRFDKFITNIKNLDGANKLPLNPIYCWQAFVKGTA